MNCYGCNFSLSLLCMFRLSIVYVYAECFYFFYVRFTAISLRIISGEL